MEVTTVYLDLKRVLTRLLCKRGRVLLLATGSKCERRAEMRSNHDDKTRIQKMNILSSQIRDGSRWVVLAAVLALCACGSGVVRESGSSSEKPVTEEPDIIIDPPPPREPPAATPRIANLQGYREPVRIVPTCYEPSRLVGQTVAEQHCSWSYNALVLQDLLSRQLPLLASQFVATHNSFNATTYPGVSSSLDPNQALSLTDQLALGMQGIELDVHWFWHAASLRVAPLICHGLGASQGHFGCTPQDRLLKDALLEIRDFLDRPEARQTVLLLDIENALADFQPPNTAVPSQAGHDEVVALFESILGDRIYKPQSGGCQSLPLARLSKQTVIDAGKQVLIVGGCGVGERWPQWVFDLDRKQRGHVGFVAETCDADFFSADDYRQRFTRQWEDSTQLGRLLSPGLQPVLAEQVRAMTQCGLNQVSLDQLAVADDRLLAFIWSWAEGHPVPANKPSCVSQNAAGRWQLASCTERRAFACKRDQGWLLTTTTESWAFGSDVCAVLGAEFSLPRTARDNKTLQEAKAKTAVSDVWLHWQDVSGRGDFPMPPRGGGL